MSKKNYPYNIFLTLLYLFISVCTALVFFIYFNPHNLDHSPTFFLARTLKELKLSFLQTSSFTTIIALLVFYLSLKLKNIKLPVSPLFYLVSLVLSLIWLIYKLDQESIGLNNFFNSSPILIKSFIYLLGSYWIILTFFKLNYLLINNSYNLNLNLNLNLNQSLHPYSSYPLSGFFKFLKKRLALISLSFISLVYLVIFFLLVPSTLFSTSSYLFLFSLVKTFIYIFTIHSVLKLFLHLKSPWWLTVFYLSSSIFSLYYINRFYLLSLTSLYSILLILFFTQIIYLLTLKDDYFKNLIRPSLFILSFVAIFILEDIGKIILLFTLTGIFIFIKKNKKNKYNHPRQIYWLFILSLLLAELGYHSTSILNNSSSYNFTLYNFKIKNLQIFSPIRESDSIYLSLDQSFIPDESTNLNLKSNLLDTHQSDIDSKLKSKNNTSTSSILFKFIESLPLLSELSKVQFWILLSLFLTLMSFIKKRMDLFILSFPFIITSCSYLFFASNVNENYLLPLIYMYPLNLCYFIYIEYIKKEER